VSVTSLVVSFQPEGSDGREKKKDRKEEARRPEEEEDNPAKVEEVAVRFRLARDG
jgi:hypothetical protein